MVIDLGPIIYMTLLIYAASGIFLAVLLSLGTWGLTKYLKRVHERHTRVRGTRPVIRSFSPVHQQGQA